LNNYGCEETLKRRVHW